MSIHVELAAGSSHLRCISVMKLINSIRGCLFKSVNCNMSMWIAVLKCVHSIQHISAVKSIWNLQVTSD